MSGPPYIDRRVWPTDPGLAALTHRAVDEALAGTDHYVDIFTEQPIDPPRIPIEVGDDDEPPIGTLRRRLSEIPGHQIVATVEIERTITVVVELTADDLTEILDAGWEGEDEFGLDQLEVEHLGDIEWLDGDFDDQVACAGWTDPSLQDLE